MWLDYVYYFVYRGRNFRPSFEKIGGLKALTNAPVMALTASASSSIQQTIASSLNLIEPVVVAHSLDRRNIFFSVGDMKGISVSTYRLAYNFGTLHYCVLYM